MARFKAKVTQDIPAYRLIGLGGINSEGDPEAGWETVYLIPAGLGTTPDLVSTGNLSEGDIVHVSITGATSWTVEASERVPAGTLVQSDADGRVKNYLWSDGNHVGFTTHSVEAGERVQVIRKPGRTTEPSSGGD